MIAVYYAADAGPYTMYSLDVTSYSDKDFISAVEALQYPMPSADIIFLEGNKVINQKFLGEDDEF